jgi:hypothetical protein
MRSPCCLCVPPNVARQWLGKHVSAAKNTNNRTVGRGVFYTVRVVSNTQFLQITSAYLPKYKTVILWVFFKEER